MSETTVFDPPAQGVWWDARLAGDDVAIRLRLSRVDIDRPRIDAAVAAAGELINDRLDRVNDLDAEDAPPALHDALREVAVEMYLRRGVSPDGLGAGVLDGLSALDIAAPDLEYAHKSRWGLA